MTGYKFDSSLFDKSMISVEGSLPSILSVLVPEKQRNFRVKGHTLPFAGLAVPYSMFMNIKGFTPIYSFLK